MKRTKEQNAVLDAAILSALGREWMTAQELVPGARHMLIEAGEPLRIGATDIGARLRGMKARGKVENRFIEEASMHEWRRSS